MITTNYLQVLSLSVAHSYFEGNICTCLQFRPKPLAAELFGRFGFRMRNKLNGFELYTTSTATLRSLFNYITSATGEVFFEFDMLSSRSDFNSFTEIPVNWVGLLEYSSRNITEGDKTLLLKETLSPPVTPSVCGNLKIYFDDLLDETEEGTTPSFEISFSARATQWQYFVINRNSVPLDNPLIKGKADIVFENRGTVTIETGERALLLSSGNALLSLSEVPVYKFDLVNELRSGGNETTTKRTPARTVFKGLPNADPAQSGLISINDKIQVSSPIYIYV